MPSKSKILWGLFSLLAFGIVGLPNTYAQQTDREAVEQAVDNYIVGWRLADKELLRSTFDMEAGVVLWLDKKGESEKLKSMTLAELASRVEPQPDYGLGYTIQSLEIIDSQLALVTVKIPMDKGHYIDCLEYQKINKQWKMVLKSFVYFPKD